MVTNNNLIIISYSYLLEIHQYSKDKISEYFKSSNAMKRVIAARRGYMYGNQFEHNLIAGLDDEFYEVRSYSVLSLAKIECTEKIDQMNRLLHDEVEEVRYRTAESLGILQHPSSIKPLLETLADPSRETRRQAVIALKKYDPSQVGKFALKYLKSITEEDIKQLDKESIRRVEIGRGIIEATGALRGDWIIEALTFAIKSDDLELVRLAAISIGENKILELLNELIRLKDHEDDDVRLAVVFALIKLDFPNQINLILEFCNDPYDFIRETIAKRIVNVSKLHLVKPCINKLKEDDSSIVRASLAGNITRTELFDVLNDLHSDKSVLVRQSVANSLGELATSESETLLRSMIAQEDDDIVQIAIKKSLSKY